MRPTRNGPPKRAGRAAPAVPYVVLLRMGFAMRPCFRADPVGSYPTFSPLPPGEPEGGMFSVALSIPRG